MAVAEAVVGEKKRVLLPEKETAHLGTQYNQQFIMKFVINLQFLILETCNKSICRKKLCQNF